MIKLNLKIKIYTEAKSEPVVKNVNIIQQLWPWSHFYCWNNKKKSLLHLMNVFEKKKKNVGQRETFIFYRLKIPRKQFEPRVFLR